MTPRFYGIVVTLFLSTILADVLALTGASLAGRALLGVEPVVFYNGLTGGLLGIGDVMHGLYKSALFSILITIVGVINGAEVTGGAEGVGKMTTRSVVLSISAIIITDMVFAYITTR